MTDILTVPYEATLPSFGSPAARKHVRKRDFVLQGNDGSWTTIPSDEYELDAKNGTVRQRSEDDSSNDVDWESYSSYRWSGTIVASGARTTITNEALTFADADYYEVEAGPDDQIQDELASDSILDDDDFSDETQSDNYVAGVSGYFIDRVTGDAEFNDITARGTVYASAGTIGGWTIGASSLTGGNATLHSSGYLLLGTSNDIVRLDAADATYRLWIGNATAASATFRVTKAGVLTATGATISGALTATSGAIGGWTIGASTISNGSISLDSSVPALKIGSATGYLTGAGIWMGLAGGAYKFHVGNPSGNYLSWDGTNLAASGQWITGGGLNPSLQSWKTNIVFSSASATQVNWTSGTIRLNDGTTYSINSGNTGAMAALTYIYLDTAVSTTVLQTTTTYSTAVGSGKVLIAAAQNNTTGASVVPFGGQQPILDGGAQIVALSITAGAIAAGAITATKISVSSLSAINADLGTITAGTVTGATIRTASSGARTEMNASNLFSLGFGGIGGYDGSAVQWYAKNSDGKWYAAGGKLVVDATALALYDGSSVVSAYLVGASTTLNGESLVAGDILFGSNAASTANIKFSGGGMTTRNATTQYISIGGRSASGANDSGFSTDVLTVTGATGAGQDLDSTGFGSGGSPFFTNFVRVTSTGNWTLRSIVVGEDGQWLFLINESANNMTISNAGTAPPGYAAIRTFDGSSPATTNAGCALFIYNATNGTWDLMSYRG